MITGASSANVEDDSPPSGPIYLLGKIGCREHMTDLVENGTVFMQRLRYYRTREIGAVGDPDEGYFACYSPKNPTFRLKVRVGTAELALPGATLRIEGAAADHAVYCMCMLEIARDDETETVEAILSRATQDPRMREFGDTIVVMKNTPEFVKRLYSAAADAGCELDCDPVTYVPPTHSGELGPFRKSHCYSFQNEWRFLTTEPIAADHLVLRLGPLTDLALLVGL
jgi:hypothetical protein